MPKLGVLLIIILLAFFIVEALNIKEGFNVSDVNEDEEYTDNVTSESFSSINNSSIGAPY